MSFKSLVDINFKTSENNGDKSYPDDIYLIIYVTISVYYLIVFDYDNYYL